MGLKYKLSAGLLRGGGGVGPLSSKRLLKKSFFWTPPLKYLSTYNIYTPPFGKVKPDQAEIIQRLWDTLTYHPNQVKRQLKPDQLKPIQAQMIHIPYYVPSKLFNESVETRDTGEDQSCWFSTTTKLHGENTEVSMFHQSNCLFFFAWGHLQDSWHCATESCYNV